jgi:hypothetical protein
MATELRVPTEDRLQQAECPVCGSRAIETLLTVPRVPVFCNVLWPTADGARGSQRADIRLAFCTSCGHVFNQAFDPSLLDYDQQYENSLHFSPSFQTYAQGLIERLVERYELPGKIVIDIGGGKGEFLEDLCERAGCTGIGFDPSYVPEQRRSDRVTFVQDYYSERYAGTYHADLICCRHVLEHIPSPRDFLTTVRRSIDDPARTAVFFEVPNVLYTLRDRGIWDLIYEHYSYFSPQSLTYAFQAAGFQVTDVRQEFGGQFLTLEARVATASSALQHDDAHVDLAGLTMDARHFADTYREKVAHWNGIISALRAHGRRVAIWGAGSKGVTFLNVLAADDLIQYVIDINPRKIGMHVAGTGQQIMSPDILHSYQPDTVIVMNPLYQHEIRATLQEHGVEADILLA